MNYDPNNGQPVNIQPVPQPTQQKGTNGWAIAGFVCSLIIGSITGFIFSVIGLSKSKTIGSGKGLSIAGIIISVLRVVIIAAFFTTFTSLVWPSVNKTIEEAAHCAAAYNCVDKGDGTATCKYLDEDRKEQSVVCPYNSTETTTTTKKSDTKAVVYSIDDDMQPDIYYADKYYLKDNVVYAKLTSNAPSTLKNDSTVDGVDVVKVAENVDDLYIVEAGQAGMNFVVIVDSNRQAYYVVNSTAAKTAYWNNGTQELGTVKIPYAKNIKNVYSLVGMDAVNIVFVNRENQLISDDNFILIDTKNKIYDCLVGNDLYKTEFVKEEKVNNGYGDVYVASYNVYKNGQKVDKTVTVTFMDSMDPANDPGLVGISICNDSYGDACE